MLNKLFKKIHNIFQINQEKNLFKKKCLNSSFNFATILLFYFHNDNI